MSSRIKSYLFAFSATSTAMLFIAIVFFHLNRQQYFDLFPVVFIIMATIHAILHIILIKNSELPPKKFINLFLLLTTIKFFIIIISLTALLFFLKSIALQIGITFLTMFICYLILEVSILMKIFKK